jgi:AcrR family transcriptional regulator
MVWPVKKEKKESILVVARHMFGKYGIQKTRLEEVARLSRVAKATIYNYFGSKDRVYLEVLDREVIGMAASISEEVARMTSPPDKLRAFVFSSFRLLRDSADIFNLRSEFMDQLISGTEDIRKTLFVRQLSILRPILKEGVESGVFRSDSVSTARSILYAVRGMELTWLLDPADREIDEGIETLFGLLCSGILTTEDARHV